MKTITKRQQAAWFDRNEAIFLLSTNYPHAQSECLFSLWLGDWAVEFAIEHALCLCCHLTQGKADFVWAKMREIILGKGDDYAGENRFSAFVYAAKFAKMQEPEMVVRAQIGIKIHRLKNLIDKQDAAKFESVADNAYDLLGYTILLAMMQENK